MERKGRKEGIKGGKQGKGKKLRKRSKEGIKERYNMKKGNN